MNNKQWEDEFDEKFTDYLKPISIGQYDKKGANIGFLNSKEVIKNFISALLEKREAEIRKETILAVLFDKDKLNTLSWNNYRQSIIDKAKSLYNINLE